MSALSLEAGKVVRKVLSVEVANLRPSARRVSVVVAQDIICDSHEATRSQSAALWDDCGLLAIDRMDSKINLIHLSQDCKTLFDVDAGA